MHPHPAAPTCAVHRLGLIDYQEAWALQRRLGEACRERGEFHLLLLEHPPTYTLGARGKQEHLLLNEAALARLGASVHRVDRGGDITFHGPGQIVVYPIVELRDPLDLRRYVRTLEEAIIATAGAFGVEAGLESGMVGVWVEGRRKLAAIGVRVKRGVTTHGLALNVNTELRWFDEMIPCGIADKEVTSLAAELGHPVDADAVEDRLTDELARLFGLTLAQGRSGPIGPADSSEQ
jgi:lipoyl(octanoyl) transferase